MTSRVHTTVYMHMYLHHEEVVRLRKEEVEESSRSPVKVS